MDDSPAIVLEPEIDEARRSGTPIVALESTIFSRLGLPAPHNEECLRRCEEVVRGANAVPAMTAIVDGRIRVGVGREHLDRVLDCSTKLSARDLGAAVGLGLPAGVTTVAAAVKIASMAGIAVFSTGGIGGVHRGAELSGDVSADLMALARWPVTTVTAGAKAFLDLARTVELLDTLGVPVVGLGTDEFPAFYSRQSGVAVPRRVETVDEVVAVVNGCRTVGYDGGVVVANPIPPTAEIPVGDIEPFIEDALERARHDGVRGADVTPFVLAALAAATDGRSLPANLALAEWNAAVAARVAVGLGTMRP